MQWPEAVEVLFTTFGVLGDAGDYIFNPACSANKDAAKDTNGTGDLFFQKQLLVLLMPFFALISSVVFWSLVAVRDWVAGKRRRRRSRLARRESIKRHNLRHSRSQRLLVTHNNDGDDDDKHKIRQLTSKLAKDHPDYDPFLDQDDVIDAFQYHSLRHPPTFLDKHMSDDMVRKAMGKRKHQKLKYLHQPIIQHHPYSYQKHKHKNGSIRKKHHTNHHVQHRNSEANANPVWLSDGVIQEWLPRKRFVNLPAGHKVSSSALFASQPCQNSRWTHTRLSLSHTHTRFGTPTDSGRMACPISAPQRRPASETNAAKPEPDRRNARLCVQHGGRRRPEAHHRRQKLQGIRKPGQR